MTKKEKYQCERCRIITANAMSMPPDDIDLVPLFNCVKRAIKASKGSGKIYLKPANSKEKKAINEKYAQFVVHKLLSTGDANFDEIVKEWHRL